MARPRTLKVGAMLELSQQTPGGDQQWLPFLVTHVHGDDLLSGVCFTGRPGPIGWNNRAAHAFDNVSKGDMNRTWRDPAQVKPEPEGTEASAG